MKKDIHNRNDIILLVNAFYEKIKTDQVIGFLFTEIAQINWENHLPKMYDFWENVLFFTGNFDGNPMQKHKELHNKCPLSHAHFNHWNEIFRQTVNELFEGKKAEEIKMRAKNISDVIMYKTIQ
ncbi:MAG TPA: group III truncated hemoglobin [Flavobacterium sp.]|uniref:group III truncated hemoglobin n=1 Tax=unclassified Flavobacterium TaxID=196869 RepID=UPI000E8A355E|nr:MULTISPECIES: group III truncated hemoglobin [unclassified Flavobacterium]HBI02236.1 hemoglobin-like protein [Flavobacterium sp.]HRE78794.1 group III truncated hemoglobin [Flavobacterium sp.]